MDTPEPQTQLSLPGSTESRSTTRRTATFLFQMDTSPTDGGLAWRDPAGYWYNMSLPDIGQLTTWLVSWVQYRRQQFKPLGFRLTSISTGETKDITDGARCEIVGDSFILRDLAGVQLGDALSSDEWTLTPILSA